MKMAAKKNIFTLVLDKVRAANSELISQGVLPPNIDQTRVIVEPPRDPSQGEMASNSAMVLAKGAGTNPRNLAAMTAGIMVRDPLFMHVEVAGPGFINLQLKPQAWNAELRAGRAYGRSDIEHDEAVNVEYVSTNPTGPMHVRHGRGAVFGDALANLLAFTEIGRAHV